MSTLPDRIVVVVKDYEHKTVLRFSGTGLYTELWPEVTPEWAEDGGPFSVSSAPFYLSKDTSLTPETLPPEGAVVVLELTNELPEEWSSVRARSLLHEIRSTHRLWRIVTD